MRNLLALIGLLILGFVGIGWYMGWYKLSFARDANGNLEIKTNVDTKKVGEDSSEFFKNAANVIGSHAEKAAQDAKTSTPPAAGATPGPVNPPQGSQNTPIAPDKPTAAPTSPQAPAGAPTTPPKQPITLFPPK